MSIQRATHSLFSKKDVLSMADRMSRLLLRAESISGFSDVQIYAILDEAKAILAPLPAMIEMTVPLTIFGDTHGQFPDLIKWFKIVGHPPETKLLFLGDYVDRCKMSFEVIMLLLCFKILYPDRIQLLRGNHECSKMNRIYGFYEELRRKRTVKMWRIFQEVFNEMPLCARVSQRILCMHGGISPHIDSWETLKKLKKPKTVRECDEGVQLDLMWSDPTKDSCGFLPNKQRSASYVFGDDSIKLFCLRMNLDLIVRAHEMIMNGHELMSGNLLCTVFSAPNYCGTDKNCGSVMKISEKMEVSFETLRPILMLNQLTPDRLRVLERQAAMDPAAKSPNPMGHRLLLHSSQLPGAEEPTNTAPKPSGSKEKENKERASGGRGSAELCAPIMFEQPTTDSKLGPLDPTVALDQKTLQDRIAERNALKKDTSAEQSELVPVTLSAESANAATSAANAVPSAATTTTATPAKGSSETTENQSISVAKPGAVTGQVTAPVKGGSAEGTTNSASTTLRLHADDEAEKKALEGFKKVVQEREAKLKDQYG